VIADAKASGLFLDGPRRREASHLGGIDFPKTKRLQNNNARRMSFSVQNHIEVAAVDAVTPRKSVLISLTLNRGSQQLNNFIIIKYERLAA
jgi:hypothetical protein